MRNRFRIGETPTAIHDRMLRRRVLLVWLGALALAPDAFAEKFAPSPNLAPSSRLLEQRSWSGVYPHLTMWNNHGECGTGAVVPWQGSLWAITYAPHYPGGSSDKLYEFTSDLTQKIFEGSVGGTHANRMIHRESNQLLIGPYIIDARKNIRVIPRTKMYGRLTGNARHLTDPANKVYYATMEEGLYEVDVATLAAKCFIRDGNGGAPKTGIVSKLPGYHGKGLYSRRGHLIYANNGERGSRVRVDPTVPSGALAVWRGEGDWRLVRRNQFTEVTGPGGIRGNLNPATDPIWAMGWDARSLILALLETKKWHYYRLPKASHSYDGAHGWNTEWPRIREIGEKDLLATMHGTFWRFPAGFSLNNSAGIAPRSNYLKVVGDFCRWNDRVVLGCDDSAKSEFLNKRAFKAKDGSPRQSNSNLWFVSPNRLDELGPAIGRGSVWLRDDVRANQVSEPYLFSGYDHRQLHLTHGSEHVVTFKLEVDRDGTNQWQTLKSITVSPRGSVSRIFGDEEKGSWIRLISQNTATGVTAHFQYRDRDTRDTSNDKQFAGIAMRNKASRTLGLMRSLAYNRLGVVAASMADGRDTVFYELNQKMELTPTDDPSAKARVFAAAQPRSESIFMDAASVVVIEDGKRYRLPNSEGRGSRGEPAPPSDPTSSAAYRTARICREVATERDLLNLRGTFYELPARNAQGLAKIRPVATHNLAIHDFCSHNGLLFFTGIEPNVNSDHIIRSADGKAAVWAGVVDDLWKLGKPRGSGGPWHDTAVNSNEPSDPYLMTGYDQKQVTISSSAPANIRLEVDVDGTGLWIPYQSFALKAGGSIEHTFATGFSAYWVRAVSDAKSTISVTFVYQ